MPAVPVTPRILRASDRSTPWKTPSGDTTPERSLWLQASVAHRVHLFELSARRERAIVAGSVRSADISIDDARVALVEFHFERAGDRIFVVPAYGARVEVNAVRLRRPEVIRTRAVIVFAGHVMRVQVFDAPPEPPVRTEHTLAETDPPCESPASFGNETIVTTFVDGNFEPEVDAKDGDSNTTRVFRPSSSAMPIRDRTIAESPAAKLVHELPTPRAAPLELSELLAIRAAADARVRRRCPSTVLVICALVATTLSGFALGFAIALLLPRSSPAASQGTCEAPADHAVRARRP